VRRVYKCRCPQAAFRLPSRPCRGDAVARRPTLTSPLSVLQRILAHPARHLNPCHCEENPLAATWVQVTCQMWSTRLTSNSSLVTMPGQPRLLAARPPGYAVCAAPQGAERGPLGSLKPDVVVPATWSTVAGPFGVYGFKFGLPSLRPIILLEDVGLWWVVLPRNLPYYPRVPQVFSYSFRRDKLGVRRVGEPCSSLGGIVLISRRRLLGGAENYGQRCAPHAGDHALRFSVGEATWNLALPEEPKE